MNVIVAVDEKWGIGKNNDLLFSLPLDMKFFREKTEGKIVIMGSNTLKSFPNSKPLKNRINIVINASPEEHEGCITAHSLDQLKDILKEYPTDDIFVVGGGMFYRTMLPYCSVAYITKVRKDGEATVFFDNLDEKPEWFLESESEEFETNGHKIIFTIYKNTAPIKFCATNNN